MTHVLHLLSLSYLLSFLYHPCMPPFLYKHVSVQSLHEPWIISGDTVWDISECVDEQAVYMYLATL